VSELLSVDPRSLYIIKTFKTPLYILNFKINECIATNPPKEPLSKTKFLVSKPGWHQSPVIQLHRQQLFLQRLGKERKWTQALAESQEV
jgi:hypothetical protein